MDQMHSGVAGHMLPLLHLILWNARRHGEGSQRMNAKPWWKTMLTRKFPTASDAVKDVGGSYYVVRQILQELQYNSKVSPVDTKDASMEKSFMSKDETPTKSVEASQTRGLGEVSPISKMATAKSSSKSLKSKKSSQSSISVEESINDETQLSSAVIDRSKDAETQSHRPIDEPKSSRHPDPEHKTKQEIIREDKLKFDGLQTKAEPQESTESEISRRELHKVPTEVAEPRSKTSVWQNLKSFANGIFSIWKRS
ncbi:uncharacterized protein LOC105159162 isoform X2 [Sesamum indicum]|uniref:Uncharacterized protein LOC105159162 isoform X2 n=1 Tax=Sesamum indicum TaxID=4182 RepID=A0A6I9SV43_SESIN|nr:uncharacterized protein LOC105159162 isoform X2 [Sesamum indicum]